LSFGFSSIDGSPSGDDPPPISCAAGGGPTRATTPAQEP
jgi:hypothetical protein